MCSSDAICNNTHGSFNCSCKPGYKRDGKNCTGNFHFSIWSARMSSNALCFFQCLFVCFILFYFLNNLLRLYLWKNVCGNLVYCRWCSIWFQTSTSVKQKPPNAVLMRFVTTPRDPTTAHVNQDMKGTEIIAQVISFVNSSFLQIIESIAGFIFPWCSLKQFFARVDHITSKFKKLKVHNAFSALYFSFLSPDIKDRCEKVFFLYVFLSSFHNGDVLGTP